MVDTVTEEKRSYIMSRVRSKDTKPEMAVRSLLHLMGYRFTVNGPQNRQLPGRPDIVLPKHHTVVFVHGCFWHGHDNCKNARIPKSRSDWWKSKIERNKVRDKIALGDLKRLGWKVAVVWECELKDKETLENKLENFFR